jgi:hypothetical protein
MAKASVIFSKDNEYYTPKEFVARFGNFDYDPATTKEKADEFGITNYDTIQTNGLTKDWTIYKRIWINPPFTRKQEFLQKAWQTFIEARNEIFILFPIEFLTTLRFHNACKGGKIFIPNSRISFESGLGKKSKSPAFGSVVMKLQEGFDIEFINIK